MYNNNKKNNNNNNNIFSASGDDRKGAFLFQRVSVLVQRIIIIIIIIIIKRQFIRCSNIARVTTRAMTTVEIGCLSLSGEADVCPVCTFIDSEDRFWTSSVVSCSSDSEDGRGGLTLGGPASEGEMDLIHPIPGPGAIE